MASGALVSHGRHSGLSAEVARLLGEAGHFLDRRDAAGAAPYLTGALALAPDHPEVLRLAAVGAVLDGRPGEAVVALRRALESRPDDALLHNNLGSALNASGNIEGAIESFRRAAALAPALPASWYNLGKTLKANAQSVEADEALMRALALAPGHVSARIGYADNLKALGRIDDAAAAYRAALAADAGAVHAWWGLANLKTVRFSEAETAALEQRFRAHEPGDRAVLGFALAKALEDRDRYPEAFTVLNEANALRREQQPWNAAAFRSAIDATIEAFSAPRDIDAASRGSEVIFIVSLPRAGSTLVEQIIAAHPEVEGASEISDLEAVITEESARRGLAFPAWAGHANDGDWRRLGERYLERTARWRVHRPRFTDKALSTWLYVGAAAAMLPGAHFVHCVRDPVETALSCYRQWFSQGQAFSYSIGDIASYVHEHARLMDFWKTLFPDACHTLVHETLIAEPEATVRALLAFCGLPFDARCLSFHQSTRSVRTASAAQVRQPLDPGTARAMRYGELLDPLRRAIEAR